MLDCSLADAIPLLMFLFILKSFCSALYVAFLLWIPALNPFEELSFDCDDR